MSSPLQQPLPLSAVMHQADDDLDEASPLGDYLADAESSFEEPLGSPFSPEPSFDDATITLRRRPNRRGSMPHPHSPKESSRSTSRRPLSISTDIEDGIPEAGPSRIPMELSPPVDTAFEERFKYLIATSGLLEKTHLDRASSRRTESESGSPPVSPNLHPPSAPSQANIPQEKATQESRWDVLTTLGAVVLGLACVLGPSTMVPTTAIAAGFVLLKPQKPEDDSDEDDDDDDNEDEGASSSDTVYASLPPSPTVEESGSSRVFSSLESLLAKSRVLDHTLTTSLQILSPYPDDTSHAHDLRIALHRLLDDMTDSLATCTSTLIPMADRAELSVLGEMYDIPVLGPRRPRRHSSGQEDLEGPVHQRSSSSPDALRSLSSLPDDKFTKLPDRTPRQRRMSASADWASPPSSYRPLLQDHSIPESNDEESASESMSSTTESSMPASLPELVGQHTSPSRNRPFVPKRASPLAQALEHLEGPTLGITPPYPVMHNRVVSGASSTSSTSYRRSLQDIRYIHSSPPSSSEAAANLAIARASANLSSANRRSLQMPIHPHDLESLEQAIAAGANLHRARSLPQSQRTGLRPLATASSPGSKRSSLISERASPNPQRLSGVSETLLPSTYSPPAAPYRRTSLLFADALRSAESSTIGMGLAPQHFARPSRITSVSPLTLGGLKAAYLGVHLKRRRVACCLLGLRFFATHQADDEYWNSICEALNVLGADMSAANERLDVVRLEAEKEVHAAKAMSAHLSPTSPPRYIMSPNLTDRPLDFAPRDTTEQALLANVDELQRTLARVWARCDEMRTRLASGEADTLADTWSEVRTDIGGLLRHVERGRELARRDHEPIDEEDEEDEEPSPPMPIPDFLRAWADPGPEELERLVDNLPDDSDPDDLPLPGMDEVYEAEIPAAAPRPKSTMSREERIALTREARARGMTLAQLTARSPEEQEKERQRQLQAERLRAESDMISELEGMFGAIRRRKGME